MVAVRHSRGQLFEVGVETQQLDPDGLEPDVSFGLSFSQLTQDSGAVM
jgi:hypothetical protein